MQIILITQESGKVNLDLDENSLGDDNIHRVDVNNPMEYNPRLPTSDLSGSNDKFIDGGHTPGGQDECVIDTFPNPEITPEVGKVSTIDNGMDYYDGIGY